MIVPASVPSVAWSKMIVAAFDTAMAPRRLSVVPIKPPLSTLVPPVWELEPTMVSVAAPNFSSAPAPAMLPVKLPSEFWPKRSTELLPARVKFPCRLVVSPANVPSLTVVPPV